MRFPKAHPVPQSADWVRPSLSGTHNLLRSSRLRSSGFSAAAAKNVDFVAIGAAVPSAYFGYEQLRRAKEHTLSSTHKGEGENSEATTRCEVDRNM